MKTCALLSIVLLGCGGDATTPDGGVVVQPSTQFAATMTSWSLPAHQTSQGFSTVAGSGWATVDLDGDGKPDLVQTSDPMTNQVWGGDAHATWKVLHNSGASFDGAVTWSIPAAGVTSGFDALGGQGWAMVDLDGDGKPDLVQTEDPMTNQVWGGDTHATWKVFHNTGHGFDAATTWGLPPRGMVAGFATVAGAGWALVDLDGDHKPELVQTSDPMTGQVWGGDAHATWKVLHNTGSGFDGAVTWYLPTRGSEAGFDAVGGSGWAMLDLDGDHKLDLVQTSDPMTGMVWGGDTHATWKVFHNTGTGFDGAIAWTVPPANESQGFESVAGSGWVTMDLDGDGKVELVQTEDRTSGMVWGGDTHATWKVFHNIDTGFATTATSWAVPGAGTSQGFSTVAGAGWATLDLDGDGHLDLVHTMDPMTNAVWGGDTRASWHAYYGR